MPNEANRASDFSDFTLIRDEAEYSQYAEDNFRCSVNDKAPERYPAFIAPTFDEFGGYFYLYAEDVEAMRVALANACGK